MIMQKKQKTIQQRFGLNVMFCHHIINYFHYRANLAQNEQVMKIDDIPLHKGNLFLGGVGSFKQPIINNYRITTVLSILQPQMMKRYKIKQHCQHFKIINHKCIQLFDKESQDIYQYFQQTYKFIKNSLKQNNVLVHCQVGVSRSASIVLAFLMRQYKLKYQEAFEVITKKRLILPNQGFVKALKKYEEEIFKEIK